MLVSPYPRKVGYDRQKNQIFTKSGHIFKNNDILVDQGAYLKKYQIMETFFDPLNSSHKYFSCDVFDMI